MRSLNKPCYRYRSSQARSGLPTATEDLYPTGSFTEGATLTSTNVAGDVHLGGWLREREVRRTQANFCIRTEHFLGEEQQGLFQVGE